LVIANFSPFSDAHHISIFHGVIFAHPPEKVKSAYFPIVKTSFDVRAYVVVYVVLVPRNWH
jgi:hypothetical protein